MAFDPTDPPIDPTIWKPSAALVRLAMRRCDWVHSTAVEEIEDPAEWLRTLVVSCYYQGLADGIKHIAKKHRKRRTDQS